MATSNKKLLLAAMLVSAFLLALVLWRIDFVNLKKTLSGVNLVFILIALTTILAEIALKAVRLKFLVNVLSRLSFSDSAIVTLVGLPLGVVTPANLGDFVKIYSLSEKSSLTKPKCLAIVALEKLIDLFCLTALLIASVMIFLKISDENTILVYLITSLAIFSLTLIMVLRKTKALSWLKIDLLSPMKMIFNDKKTLAAGIGISFLLWLNRMLRVFLVALALGIKINSVYFFLFLPIVEFVQVLPITVMGLGIREYFYILLLPLIGISKEASLLLSLLSFLVSIIPLLLLGYLATIREMKSKPV